MKKSSKILSFIFLFLVLFPLVNAQATPQQGADNFPTGFEIEFTKLNILKANQNHLFNIHVLNISNGVRIDNTTTICDFHLMNSSGYHILDQERMDFNTAGQDWELETLGGNFSSVGQYSYLVVCQDSTFPLGGFVSIGIEVTPSGVKQNTVFENPEFILLLVLALIFLALGAGLTLPSLGFIGSVLLILSGIQTMIYGFNNVTNLYTRGGAVSIIGLGILFMFISAYEWLYLEKE